MLVTARTAFGAGVCANSASVIVDIVNQFPSLDLDAQFLDIVLAGFTFVFAVRRFIIRRIFFFILAIGPQCFKGIVQSFGP